VLRIRRGEVADGLRHLPAEFQRAGSSLTSDLWTRWNLLGEMAEGLARAGHVDDAVAVVRQAIDRCERNEEGWLLAELLRLSGELVLRQDGPSATATADGHFRRALDFAHHQGALACELRTSTSLARLQRNLSRPDEGRAVLQPGYERFTEGFDTADLLTAKQLLNELSQANPERSTTDP
jgi:predicted ATPase